MNAYRAFGLNILSDLEIIEFLPSSFDPTSVDVKIASGQVPISINGDSASIHFQANENQALLNIKNIAHFLIENGQKITYKSYPSCDQDTLRLFLLGSCMGALMQQRGHIVLHGNTVSSDLKTCTVYVGNRGSGKSTMAGWYYQQGAHVLADDVCVIAFDKKGTARVVPSYPQIKLWEDSAKLLGINTQNLRQVRPQDNKFALSVHSQYYKSSLPLAEIIEINTQANNLSQITSIEKIQLLIRHSYRYHFLKKMGLTHAYVKQLMKLSGQVIIKKTDRIALTSSDR